MSCSTQDTSREISVEFILKNFLSKELNSMKSLIESNHISISNQLNIVKQEIYEKYDKKIAEVDVTISSLEGNFKDVSITVSHAFDLDTKNLNDMLNIKIEIMNLKKSNNETAEKLDDNINRSMRSNLVFFNVPEQKGETYDTTKIY